MISSDPLLTLDARAGRLRRECAVLLGAVFVVNIAYSVAALGWRHVPDAWTGVVVTSVAALLIVARLRRELRVIETLMRIRARLDT